MFIITARAISGTAIEDQDHTFSNEITIVAVIEISLYIIGSIAAIWAYWYTYLYFRRLMTSGDSANDSRYNYLGGS